MQRHFFRKIVFFCLTLILFSLPPAQAQPSPQVPQTSQAPQTSPAPATSPALKVATRVLKPFVFYEDKKLTGFSIELWRAIARELDRKFEFVEIKTLPDLLSSVGGKKADLAISAISITAERETRFDFSQPMFDAGLQILVLSAAGRGAGGLSQMWQFFQTTGLLELLGLMIILMIIPAPIIWLIERRHEKNLFRSSRKGGEFFNSLWWSSTTLAGQATDMPNSPTGRVVAIIWIFIGIVFISYFTANVTTALTVSKLEQSIKGPGDLAGKNVAAVRGSTGAGYLKSRNIATREFDQITDAYKRLLAGQVDAIVYDAPILLYYAAHEGKGRVTTTGSVFRPEAYGILFPNGSKLRKPVNAALLKLKETGEYRSLYTKYFSTGGTSGK